ncbi:MAG: hypothetical protein NTW33_09945, partial [Methanoregula sp.]|nr:hypothetical protein [Methanoregula sp.]
NLLIYSFFGRWFSSIYCYGSRFLTGIVPILILYFGIFLKDHFTGKHDIVRKRTTTIVITILIISSVLIHGIGVYYYTFIPDKAMSDVRAWDWNDTLIVGSVQAAYGQDILIKMHSFPPFHPFLEYNFASKDSRKSTNISSINISSSFYRT